MTVEPRDEDGIAMITVILIAMVVTMLSSVIFTTTTREVTQSAASARRATAFQAAEAGIDDYVSKLTEDRMYYVHNVHPAESTRTAPSGAVTRAGQPWTADLQWTYAAGKDAWRSLPNGYEYNLMITPPTAGSAAVRILATGRRAGATAEMRAIEVLVRPSSVADFQMIANRDIGYGDTATTRGKLYAGIDENGVAHSITHAGTAYADVYAEKSITRHPTYRAGARGYTSVDIRTRIKNPINFNAFTGSLVEIQRVAQGSGLTFNDTSVDAWSLSFEADGNVAAGRCTRRGAHLAAQAPSCTPAGRFPVPAAGAIYVGQSVAVSGVVRGRVTVASNADVVIGGNISYERSGADVLGLIARGEMIVAEWAPFDLTWRAATIAQSGQWRSYSTNGSHGTLTFTGSTATNLGGYMNMFRIRNYNYDETLQYLAPPYFPVLEEAYTVLLFRELPSSST